MDVLIIGSGGREHAIAWSISKSGRAGRIYCISGNAGIAEIAECHPEISVMDFDRIIAFIKERPAIGLVMVASDDPLGGGLVDEVENLGIRVFGPRKNAAIIESSKAFSKAFMKRNKIPTADYEVFSDFDEAVKYLKTVKYPIVIKADGLARGKGVIICNNFSEAEKAAEDMIVGGAFGDSGSTVVIEQFLTGYEVTVLAFTDGRTVVPMCTSQDHKRALDGDLGLNTGGMGTFSPSDKFSDDLCKQAMSTIFMPTIDGMRSEGREFKGVIYFGLMVEGSDIRVIEYNARFGDPEAQSILPRLRTDILDIFDACIDGTLDKQKIEFEDNAVVCVVLCSGGYPGDIKKGLPITIGDIDDGVLLFHAGTKVDGGRLVTDGGRVIGVTACADTLENARKLAYKNAGKIHFENMHYRRDICKLKER